MFYITKEMFKFTFAQFLIRDYHIEKGRNEDEENDGFADDSGTRYDSIYRLW